MYNQLGLMYSGLAYGHLRCSLNFRPLQEIEAIMGGSRILILGPFTRDYGKSKKFNLVHQTISRREAHVGWERDYGGMHGMHCCDK